MDSHTSENIHIAQTTLDVLTTSNDTTLYIEREAVVGLGKVWKGVEKYQSTLYEILKEIIGWMDR